MREFRTPGSVRGAPGNGRPYRDIALFPRTTRRYLPIPKTASIIAEPALPFRMILTMSKGSMRFSRTGDYLLSM